MRLGTICRRNNINDEIKKKVLPGGKPKNPLLLEYVEMLYPFPERNIFVIDRKSVV